MINNTKPQLRSMVDVTTTKRDFLKCSLSRRYSTHIIHVCHSGHVICDSCDKDKITSTKVITNYENFKYDDKTSTNSTIDLMDNIMNQESNTVSKTEYKLGIKPRPVSCPDLECRKMLALDSVLMHFYFDHSKVPKHNVNDSLSEIVLKISDLSSKSRCVAMFLDRRLSGENMGIEKIDPHTLPIDHYNNYNLLLLMSARYSSSSKPIENNLMTNNLLLWMCKVNDNDICSSITVLKDDKRLGYSYIGEAIHIREQQDAELMNTRAECLIINAAAVDEILNNEEQFKVYVNILN